MDLSIHPQHRNESLVKIEINSRIWPAILIVQTLAVWLLSAAVKSVTMWVEGRRWGFVVEGVRVRESAKRFEKRARVLQLIVTALVRNVMDNSKHAQSAFENEKNV
jgi:hypothetical protein